MKSIVLSAILLTAVTVGLLMSSNKREDLSQVQIENIEALSGNEKIDLWCCGTQGDCVVATNVVLVGKLSKHPC